MKKLTVGSCFSGIGGLELGLEWTGGFETKWQIENDPKAIQILQRHWPTTTRYTDIRNVDGKNIESVDVICGGFPCQDVSQLGKKSGIKGNRSGLWKELLRLACEIRPSYLVVENVPGLFNRGFGTVLGDLALNGFDAEWSIISSCSVGAPHTRERVFIVAYPNQIRCKGTSFESRSVCEMLGERISAKAKLSVRENLWDESILPTLGLANGIPTDLGAVALYGNAVMPQVAQKIGEMILEYERERKP